MTNANKITIISIIICALIVFSITATLDKYKTTFVKPFKIQEIVIDAGHGGFDGGAEGEYGIVEKDINLIISSKLKDILLLNGFKVTMTRESDISIHDDNSKNKKVSDMKNRLKIINNNPYSLTVSIHQNKFEQKQYSGAQVFYSPNNQLSEVLANSLQLSFAQNLQKENKREIKKAEKNLFLLHNAKNPAVIVECGFISNPSESLLLKDDEYQNQVAFTIYIGLMNFLDEINM